MRSVTRKLTFHVEGHDKPAIDRKVYDYLANFSTQEPNDLHIDITPRLGVSSMIAEVVAVWYDDDPDDDE